MKTGKLTQSPPWLVWACCFLMMLFSCTRLPKADFGFFPGENPEEGDTIWFTNLSLNANLFAWEFGDGETSNQVHPWHIYRQAGIFDVILTATNEVGSDSHTLTLKIFEPTILGYVVYDSSGTIPLEGARIWVFDNEAARDSMQSPLYSGITNSEGAVEFRNVDPIIYHSRILKETPEGDWSHTGYTSPLLPNKVNIFTVPCNWTEQYDSTTCAPGVPHLLRYRQPT